VATGAAATREASTERLPGDESAKAGDIGRFSQTRESSPPRSRRLFIGAGLIGLVAAAVIAVVLISGGGGGGGEAATGRTSAEKTTSSEPKQQKPKPKPKPAALSAAALISKGDAVCERSQATFGEVGGQFPNGENEASVAYSEELVGISSLAVEGFDALRPPDSLKAPYEAYVKSQKDVAKWDEDALKAAEAGDLTKYLEAREERDATQEQRQGLAEAVGFHVCSGSEA
jgi:hypothetical protein